MSKQYGIKMLVSLSGYIKSQAKNTDKMLEIVNMPVEAKSREDAMKIAKSGHKKEEVIGFLSCYD